MEEVTKSKQDYCGGHQQEPEDEGLEIAFRFRSNRNASPTDSDQVVYGVVWQESIEREASKASCSRSMAEVVDQRLHFRTPAVRTSLHTFSALSKVNQNTHL